MFLLIIKTIPYEYDVTAQFQEVFISFVSIKRYFPDKFQFFNSTVPHN